MYVKNREEYREIQISELKFSTRTFNWLKRANVSTLYLLIENIENLEKIRNLGAKSIAEIKKFLNSISENESTIEDKKALLTKEILCRPASDLKVSARIINCFKIAHIKTIGQVLALDDTEILRLKNMGILSQKQLLKQIEFLYKMGEDYFKRDIIDFEWDEDERGKCQIAKKGFDFSVIDKLVDKFNFKIGKMTKWFGFSRQYIHDVIDKRPLKRREIWTGKRLDEKEKKILLKLLDERKFYYNDENIICYCINDRQGDLSCIFVNENEIKCFFLKDLPDDLQQMIKKINFG